MQAHRRHFPCTVGFVSGTESSPAPATSESISPIFGAGAGQPQSCSCVDKTQSMGYTHFTTQSMSYTYLTPTLHRGPRLNLLLPRTPIVLPHTGTHSTVLLHPLGRASQSSHVSCSQTWGWGSAQLQLHSGSSSQWETVLSKLAITSAPSPMVKKLRRDRDKPKNGCPPNLCSHTHQNAGSQMA